MGPSPYLFLVDTVLIIVCTTLVLSVALGKGSGHAQASTTNYCDPVSTKNFQGARFHAFTFQNIEKKWVQSNLSGGWSGEPLHLLYLILLAVTGGFCNGQFVNNKSVSGLLQLLRTY